MPQIHICPTTTETFICPDTWDRGTRNWVEGHGPCADSIDSNELRMCLQQNGCMTNKNWVSAADSGAMGGIEAWLGDELTGREW